MRWLILGSGLFLVALWVLFFQAVVVLVAVGGILLAVWGWWEVRTLRQAIRESRGPR